MAIPTFLLREYSKGGCLDSCTMANKVDPLPQNAKGVWRIRVDFPPHMLGWQVIPSTTSMSGTWKGFTVMSPFMFQKIHSMIVTTYQPTQTKKNSYPYYVPLCKQKTAISTYTFEKLRWKLKILPLEKEKQWETSRNHQFWEFQPLVFWGVTH